MKKEKNTTKNRKRFSSFLNSKFYRKFWRWKQITSEQITTRRGRGERRQYINRRGKSDHVSPAIVVKHLAGMRYPADKQKLIDHAQSKDAPDEVINLINKFSEKTYTSPIDVTKEIGKIK